MIRRKRIAKIVLTIMLGIVGIGFALTNMVLADDDKININITSEAKGTTEVITLVANAIDKNVEITEIKLPNGIMVTGSEAEYEVSENSNYEFKVFYKETIEDTVESSKIVNYEVTSIKKQDITESVAKQNRVVTPRAIVQSGTIGTVDWSLDDAGVLTFGGGVFPDNYDWYTYYETDLGKVMKANTKIVNFTAPIAGGTKLNYFFNGYSILTTINGFNNLDTSRVTVMNSMFSYCTNLNNLDLSSFNTSNVTNMGFMFYGCESLANLNISGFNTNKVTNMGYMFYAARIRKLELGPDFRFKYSNHDLQNIPSAQYTGKWKLVETGEVFTHTEFIAYNGTKPGTYIWEVNKYNVNYNSNGGSAVASEIVEYGGKVTEQTNPTRVGYTFGGWYKEASLTNQWNFTTDEVQGNVTLYAKWNVNLYNVNYNSNGGSAVASEVAGYNLKITQPTTPTREGYTFNGWYKEASLTNQWNFTTDVMPMNDITLYAKWTINSYNVNYNSNGGSAVASETVVYNAKVTKPANPTRIGYTFDGWYKESSFTNQWNFTTDVMLASDITLYAKWNINSYNVNYNSNGGSAVASESVGYNLNVTQPTIPTREGYTFDGWYKEASLTNQWNFTTGVMPANDITLYAKWTINSYSVNYSSNGGSAVASETVVYNEKATQPTNPTREGYTFAGWYKETNFTNQWNFTTDVMPANDITLYAKWTINSYNVSYDSKGGSAVASETVVYNEKLTQPTIPTRVGYTFGGWYKEEGFINQWNFTTGVMPASDITLYAKWTLNLYNVNYDSKGGSAVASEVVGYNLKVIEPTKPTREGYTFGGWYKEEDFTNQWDFAADVMPTNDITLYAKWTINSYNVNYDSKGGSAVASEAVVYKEKATQPADPTREGYTFDGWYKEANFINQWDFTTDVMPASDITLYAKWTLNLYNVSYDSKGGSAVASEAVGYNLNVTQPTTPTKEGYTFGGWYKEEDFTNQWNFTTDVMPTNDITLYAKWDMIIINIAPVSVQTGDNTSMGMLIVNAIGSIGIILMLNKKRKESFK